MPPPPVRRSRGESRRPSIDAAAPAPAPVEAKQFPDLATALAATIPRRLARLIGFGELHKPQPIAATCGVVARAVHVPTPCPPRRPGCPISWSRPGRPTRSVGKKRRPRRPAKVRDSAMRRAGTPRRGPRNLDSARSLCPPRGPAKLKVQPLAMTITCDDYKTVAPAGADVRHRGDARADHQGARAPGPPSRVAKSRRRSPPTGRGSRCTAGALPQLRSASRRPASRTGATRRRPSAADARPLRRDRISSCPSSPSSIRDRRSSRGSRWSARPAPAVALCAAGASESFVFVLARGVKPT